MIIKIQFRMSYFYLFLANQTLVIHKASAINTPNSMTRILYLSTPLTNGDTTATPKTICPALSKMFDTLFNWLVVNTGFLFRSQLFISMYDSLEFGGVSRRSEPLV